MAFLTKVMTNAIISTLRKKEVKTSRSGKTIAGRRTHRRPLSSIEAGEPLRLRSLLRDDAFREALDQCTADDETLKEYVVAIEMFEDSIPAARDIAVAAGSSGDRNLRTAGES